MALLFADLKAIVSINVKEITAVKRDFIAQVSRVTVTIDSVSSRSDLAIWTLEISQHYHILEKLNMTATF